MPEIDFKTLAEAANVDETPPPPSNYLVDVEAANWAKTKNGKDMLKLRFRIASGPEKGKALFDQLVISPESDIATRIFFQSAAALGLTPDTLQSMSDEEHYEFLIGRQVSVETDVKEWKGEQRAEVKSYTAVDDNGGGASVPASPSAPPPLDRTTTAPPPPFEPPAA